MESATEIATRLTKASRKKLWDVYGLDWPEQLQEGAWYMSPELVSIYGTELWDSLDEAQQKKLSLYETGNFFSIVLLGLAIPAALGFVLSGFTLWGAFTAFIWGGLVRIFLQHHATWSVNSICHMYGDSPFETDDHSRNNWAVAFVSLGEGWHHNHHAFPTSAKHGLTGRQIDPSYMFIKGLEKVGLAWNLREPSEEAIQSKLRVVSTENDADFAPQRKTGSVSESIPDGAPLSTSEPVTTSEDEDAAAVAARAESPLAGATEEERDRQAVA